jgi:hypothetical protein
MVFERPASEVEFVIERQNGAKPICVPISPGELLDRLTIPQIKAARIPDDEKLRPVRKELEAFVAARQCCVPTSEALAALTTELRAINEKLWDVENELRRCERNGDFGPRFTELARSVYRLNDRRSALKRQINALLGVQACEQKWYTSDE